MRRFSECCTRLTSSVLRDSLALMITFLGLRLWLTSCEPSPWTRLLFLSGGSLFFSAHLFNLPHDPFRPLDGCQQVVVRFHAQIKVCPSSRSHPAPLTH